MNNEQTCMQHTHLKFCNCAPQIYYAVIPLPLPCPNLPPPTPHPTHFPAPLHQYPNILSMLAYKLIAFWSDSWASALCVCLGLRLQTCQQHPCYYAGAFSVIAYSRIWNQFQGSGNQLMQAQTRFLEKQIRKLTNALWLVGCLWELKWWGLFSKRLNPGACRSQVRSWFLIWWRSSDVDCGFVVFACVDSVCYYFVVLV